MCLACTEGREEKQSRSWDWQWVATWHHRCPILCLPRTWFQYGRLWHVWQRHLVCIFNPVRFMRSHFILQIYRHAMTLYLSAGSHFGLTQKSKNNDPEDLSLLESKGFFPHDEPYQEYIAQAGESKEVSLYFISPWVLYWTLVISMHMCRVECPQCTEHHGDVVLELLL